VALTCRDYGISQQARWIWSRRYPVTGPAAGPAARPPQCRADALGLPGGLFTATPVTAPARREPRVPAALPPGTRPVRLGCLEYERSGRRRVERRANKHLKCDPMQVGLSLALQGEVVPQMLSAHHILQYGIAI
jgi:hypothetical protein